MSESLLATGPTIQFITEQNGVVHLTHLHVQRMELVWVVCTGVWHLAHLHVQRMELVWVVCTGVWHLAHLHVQRMELV